MIKHLPNFITLCNLFCGCCALLYVQQGALPVAAWFTAASFGFDYLDGMLARALKVHSDLGKQLDSLADVVSFGVVPGALLYHLLCLSFPDATHTGVQIAALPAFVLSMFSALRLGKFNLDTRQTDYFIGLSTPANTLLVLGLALGVHFEIFEVQQWVLQPVLLYSLVALLSWLLVAEIPMFGMKIKKLDWRSNRIPLLLLVLSIPAFYFLHALALTAMVILYILFSIVFKHEIYRGN